MQVKLINCNRKFSFFILLTNIDAFFAISDIEDVFVLTTGHPDFIASITGIPNPS